MHALNGWILFLYASFMVIGICLRLSSLYVASATNASASHDLPEPFASATQDLPEPFDVRSYICANYM